MRHEQRAASCASPEERARLHALEYPGTTNLATAENALIFDQLAPYLRDASDLALAHTRYNATAWGSERLRGHVAGFLSESYGLPVPLAADDLVGMAGVSAALEALAFTEAIFPDMGLGHGHGKVMIPTPCWPGFEWAFHYRAGHQILAVPVTADGFELSLTALQDAYERAPEPKPRLLALTHPHNPLGINYSRDFLEALFTWVLDHTQMHVVSDEIYAHSQIRTVQQHPFVSALALDVYAHHPAAKKRIHAVWGFAKDFGLAGFKAGFLISHNAAVRTEVTARRMAWMAPIDSLKELMLEKLAGPPGLLRRLTTTYQGQLAAAHRQVRSCLDDYRIPYFTGVEAGQFFWLDLRKYLGLELRPDRSKTDPAQRPAHRASRPSSRHAVEGPNASLYPELAGDDDKRLEGYLKDHAQLLLLPGQLMHHAEPGFFRLCFTAEPPDTVTAAIRRMHEVLSRLEPPRAKAVSMPPPFVEY